MKSDPISLEDLQNTLSVNYTYFIDEGGSLIKIKNFIEFFNLKCHNRILDFIFWIECNTAYNEIHCKHKNGMKFIFPLRSSLRKLIKLKKESK
jgi:hypothetical protein